ncbi:hypothetical protein ACHWQZ_G012251 [Mnemiopsis leidyi]
MSLWKGQVADTRNIVVQDDDDDDWDTDADFVNDISEKDQRWGSKTIENSLNSDRTVNVAAIREDVVNKHEQSVKEQYLKGPKASDGYGGKFGVHKGRMDKSAVGFEHQSELSKHASQTDAAKGFGGKFGVQKDRVDKSAVGFEHQSELSKHASQTDAAKGFGGKFGVQKDRVDKSAHSFGEVEHGAQYKTAIDVKGDVKNFRSRFENFGAAAEEENRRKVEEEKRKRDLEFKRQVEASKKKEAAAEELRAKEEQFRIEEEQKRKEEEERRDNEARRLHAENEQKRLEEERQAEEQRRLDDERRSREEYAEEQRREEEEQRRLEEDRNREEQRRVEVQRQEEEKRRAEEDRRREEEQRIEEERRLAKERKLAEERRLAEERKLAEERAAAEAAAQQQSVKSGGKQAKALYDYVAGDDDEISFSMGDLISQIEMIDDGWATGSIGGKSGMFPVGYVDIVEEGQPPSPSKPGRSQPALPPSEPPPLDKGLCGTAIYDYDAADSDEITFAEGEEITNIEMPDPGWWIGICRGKRGIFPKAYIEIKESASQEDLGQCGTAIYDYTAGADDETSLTEGGRITNIEIIDEGWWIGISDGKKGMFPASYVQLD